MPYYKCRKCHHEFEFILLENEKNITCDWCGVNKPIMLEQETPLERLFKKGQNFTERLTNGDIHKRKKDKAKSK